MPRHDIPLGTTFGRWTVEAAADAATLPSGQVKRRMTVRCSCGNTGVVLLGNLTSGRSRSCGCLNAELASTLNVQHGRYTTPEYRAWGSLLYRCTNPKSRGYADYGGRGITVCPEWRTDFAAFLAHVGPRPGAGYSIDRKDNDGGYEPGNIRWATASEQASNRRPSRRPTVSKAAR